METISKQLAVKLCADIAAAFTARAEDVKMRNMELANYFRGCAGAASDCANAITAAEEV